MTILDKVQEIKNQKDQYIIPENIKKDITVLGVTGTLEGAVKLFNNTTQMQADTTAKEGDLAVVYREEIQPVTEYSKFYNCIFPNTVVLDEAFTGNVYGGFRAVDPSVMFDGMINMSSSNFRFDGYGDSGEIRVQYSSQDGITYTRTDGGEELQELGTTIKWESRGNPFNSVIGNFMKVSGNYFEGLFQYLNVDTNNQLTFNPSSLNISDTTINLVQAGPILNYEILKSAAKYLSQFYTNEFQFDAYIDYDNKVHIIYAKSGYNSFTRVFVVNKSNPEIYMGPSGSTVAEHFDAIYDDVEKTFKNEQSITFTTMFKNIRSSGFNCVKINGYPICAIGIQQYNYDKWRHFNSTIYYLDTIDSSTNINITDSKLKLNEMVTKYVITPNQFNLTSSNQLLPKIKAYGKNGVVEGDGSIYSNLKIAESVKNSSDIDIELLLSKQEINGKLVTTGNDFNKSTMNTTYHTVQKFDTDYTFHRIHSKCIIGYKTETSPENKIYIALFDFNGNILFENSYSFPTSASVLPYIDDDNNIYISFESDTTTQFNHYIKKISLQDYSEQDIQDITVGADVLYFDSIVLNNNVYTVYSISGSATTGHLCVNGSEICTFSNCNYDTTVAAVVGRYVYIVSNANTNKVYSVNLDTKSLTTITLYDSSTGSGYINIAISYKRDGLVCSTKSPYSGTVQYEGAVGRLTDSGTFNVITYLPETFATGSSEIEEFSEIIDSEGKLWLYFDSLLNLETGEKIAIDLPWDYLTLVQGIDGIYRSIYDNKILTFRPDIQLNNSGNNILFQTVDNISISGESFNLYAIINKRVDLGNPISTKEFNTALDTADQILGEGV